MMRGSTSISQSRFSSSTTTPILIQQQRHSSRFLKHQFVETQQPKWLATRQEGRSFVGDVVAARSLGWRNAERNPQSMNLWFGDSTPSINPHLRKHNLVQSEMNKLVGRKTSLYTTGVTGYASTMTPWEQENDLRYRGVDRNMQGNIFYEPSWNQMIERIGSHQTARNAGSLNSSIVYPSASKNSSSNKQQNISNKLSEESVQYWWNELDELVKKHLPAVGEYAPGRARNIRKVQEFFVQFSEAINSFQFQDGYISQHLFSTRPAHLQDLYGLFLEMEVNRINPDYCARCGQNTHTTAFCGQGDRFSLYRQYRGRPVPHKPWAREWLEAACNRSEALWYRAAEDPFFGNAGVAIVDPNVSTPEESPGYYTQKQVEMMLKMYCMTKQRGRANAFMVNILGSREYTYGKVVITEQMQQMYDELLATTPHPHLLTNINGSQPAAASRYLPGLGAGNVVPQSAAQVRIDMEVARIRREQKEEGVVRIPPKDWEIDTKSIVPYKVDPKTGLINNWDEVRQSIEKSYLKSGLPETAWMAHELREMKYLEDRIQHSIDRNKKLESEMAADRQLCKNNPSNFKLFPDADAYRAFDVKPESIASMFRNSGSGAGEKKFNFGDVVALRASVFPDPENVPVKIGSVSLQLNCTDDMCKLFGDFAVGMKIHCTPAATAASSSAFDAIILGVEVSGSPSEWSLQALKLSPGSNPTTSSDAPTPLNREVISLGVDLHDIKKNYSSINKVGLGYGVPELDACRTEREFHNATIIGVRNDNLYVQFHLDSNYYHNGESTVAVPLGRREVVSSTARYDMRLKSQQQQQQNSNSNTTTKVREPHSWNIPFRNDNSERRLDELKQAPWLREDVAPLIAHGYTPKEKRFGYTQHIKQDDFMTAEYRNRLLARQYFTNAQKFRVIPDRVETAANFNGKTAFVKTQGFPSVDRRELEDGWAPTPEVPKYEVESVEQALRDISGTRPGNFLRAPEEVASVDLEESWWKRANPHWKQKEAEDEFEHPALRRKIDPNTLPFGGDMPLAGSTMGIGDRLKEAMEDMSRSFDLGPNGHGAQSNHVNARYNTLGSQDARSDSLSVGDALRDLFITRIRADGFDNTSFVVSRHCNGADPKTLLISLNEWMEHGKAPSLVLVRILQRYLATDIATYNSNVPEGVPQLSLDALTKNGIVSLALCSTSPWTHRRSLSYRKMLSKNSQSAAKKFNTESWLVSFYVEQQTLSLPGDDPDLRQNAFETVSQQLLIRLRGLIGKGLDDALLRNNTFLSRKAARSVKDSATTPAQLVRSTEVAKLLVDIGVPSEQRSLFMTSLYEESMRAAQNQTQAPQDFVTTVPLVLSIENIDRARAAVANSASSSSSPNTNNNNNVAKQNQDDLTQSSSSSSSGSYPLSNEATMPEILDRLMFVRDGYAADLLYIARENKKRRPLFEEFCRLAYARQIAGIHKLNNFIKEKPDYALTKGLRQEDMLERFNAYCDGKWVPRVNEAVELLAAFIRTAIRNMTASAGNNTTNNSSGKSLDAALRDQLQNASTTNSALEETNNVLLSFFSSLRDETSKLLYRQGAGEFQGQRKVYFDIEMPSLDDLEQGPFEFDNVVSEKRSTLDHLSEWTPQRRAGAHHEYVPLLPSLEELNASVNNNTNTNNNNNNTGETTAASAGQQQQQQQQQQSNNNNNTLNNKSYPSMFQYGIKPAYITNQYLHGLDIKIQAIANSNEDCPSAQLREELTAFSQDPVLVSKLANRILNRCFPVLKTWHQAVLTLQETERMNSRSIQQNANTLTTLNRAVDDAQQEQDFRSNAERYWKKVIDTGGVLSEGGPQQRMGGGGRGRGGGRNFNSSSNNNNNNDSSSSISSTNPDGSSASASQQQQQSNARKFDINFNAEGKSFQKRSGNNNNNEFRDLGNRMNNNNNNRSNSPSLSNVGGGRGSGGRGNNTNNNRGRGRGLR
jgi:hypothetical protein